MRSRIRFTGWLLGVALSGLLSPLAAQQSTRMQAALNFRFSAAEIEAVVQARNNLLQAVTNNPVLTGQIQQAWLGNPTLDVMIDRLRQLPEVKKAYNSAGLSVSQGVMAEAALLATAKAYQNWQQNPGARPITPAMQSNLTLYQKYSGDFDLWTAELAAGQPVVDPDMVGTLAVDSPDNVVTSPDLQRPGNINKATDPDIQQGGNVNVAKDPDMRPPGNVNVAKDPDVQKPGNVNTATDPDTRMVSTQSHLASDPDVVNPIMSDPDNVAP